MRVDDSRLQGIPRYKTNNCKSLSLARCEFKRLAEDPLGQADMLVARISVANFCPALCQASDFCPALSPASDFCPAFGPVSNICPNL